MASTTPSTTTAATAAGDDAAAPAPAATMQLASLEAQVLATADQPKGATEDTAHELDIATVEMLSMPRPPVMQAGGALPAVVMGELDVGLHGQDPKTAEAGEAKKAEEPAATTTSVALDEAKAAETADDDSDDDAGSVATKTSVVDDILARAGARHNTRLVWYFARRNGGAVDRFQEVACRPLSILRPGIDMIALPLGFPKVDDLWAWAVKTFDYQLWQCLWYPVTTTKEISPSGVEHEVVQVEGCHERVVSSVASLMREHLDEVMVIPFQRPKSLDKLCSAAGLTMFGDSFDGLAIKDCLHPRPWDGAASVPDTVLKHPHTGEPTSIAVPRGFTCTTPQELKDGYTAMLADGATNVVLKPSWTSSGHGIEMHVTQERIDEYTWDSAKGSIVLEEFLEVDSVDGRAKWPVVHFVARSRCGDIVEQLIAGTTSYNGTVSPCVLSSAAETAVETTAQAVAEAFKFTGFWGVDLLVSKGVPYLIDVNSGRPNGGHVPKIFVSQHAPGQPFKFWKENDISSECDVNNLYGRLVERGLAFSKAKRRGIIILHAFAGVIATLMAIGRGKKDLARLLETWSKESAYIMHQTDTPGGDAGIAVVAAPEVPAVGGATADAATAGAGAGVTA